MNQIYIVVTLLQSVFGRPYSDRDAQLTWYESYNDGQNFGYGFQTTNGITQRHSGHLTQSPNGQAVVITQGIFSFLTPDNVLLEVHYTSDENGYHPHVSTRYQNPDRSSRQFADAVTTALPSDQPNPTYLVPGILQVDNVTSTEVQELHTTQKPVPSDETVLNVTQKPIPGNETVLHITQKPPPGGETALNVTKQGSIQPEEFPNRIGQTAIITLQGPPG